MAVGAGLLARMLAFKAASIPLQPAERWAEYQTNAAFPNFIPAEGALISAYVNGTLDQPSFVEALKFNGVKLDGPGDHFSKFEWNQARLDTVAQKIGLPKDPWTGVLIDQSWIPDLSMVREWYRRGAISLDMLKFFARRHGILSEKFLGPWLLGTNNLPQPFSLLQAATRSLILPKQIDDPGILREMPQEYLDWMQCLGYGPTQGLTDAAGGVGPTIDTAKLQWALHWQFPGTHELFLMKRRLRLSKDGAGPPRDPSGIVIQDFDVDNVLQASAIHPDWRGALEAVSHPPISVRYMRVLIDQGVIDETETKELLEDQGYIKENAALLAKGLIRQQGDKRRKQVEGEAKGLIDNAWETGILTDDEYTSALTDHGLSAAEATTVLKLAVTKKKSARAKKVIAAVHRQYISGRIDRVTAGDRLIDIGLVGSRITEYLADWDLELLGDRREFSAGQIMSAAKAGLITADYAIQRLVNLRYGGEDLIILRAEIDLARAKALAQALAVAQRERDKEQRLLKQAIKEREAALKALQRELAAHGSPSQLRKWFCEFAIGEDEVFYRLRFLGWPDADILRLISDCKAPKGGVTPNVGPPPPIPQAAENPGSSQ